MSVQVYGCNHVAIEVDDVETAMAFYHDVFNLQKLDAGSRISKGLIWILVWSKFLP